MNKKIVGILAFVVGAAAGAFGSKFLLEKKYQDNLKEEMSKIQEYYKTKDDPKPLEEEMKEPFTPEIVVDREACSH